MSFLLGAGRHLARLLLVTGFLAVGMTASTGVTPALATNEAYSCSSCNSVNAPNNNWDSYIEATNYSGNGVCAGFWWYKNGEYKGPYEECRNPYYETCFSLEAEFYGHGFTRAFYSYNYHLAGRQTNYYCPYYKGE